MHSLLYVSDVCPWPSINGALLRHANLIKGLSERFQLRLVVLDDPPSAGMVNNKVNTEYFPIREYTMLPPLPTSKWGLRSAIISRLLHPDSELVRQHNVSAIVRVFGRLKKIAESCDFCWVAWPYFAHLAMLNWQKCRIVTDFIDVNALSQWTRVSRMPWCPHRIYAATDMLKMGLFERSVARRSWKAVVCKPEDGLFLGGGRNICVVPNGTDIRPDLSDSAGVPGRMLFVGLMSYQPNSDAMLWFGEEVLPRMQCACRFLDIIGKEPSREVRSLELSGLVRVHGYVDDLIECYKKAKVVIAPIRLGSGTRLKVLESLSFGKPLVATTEATRGLGLVPGLHYLAADTAREFAENCDLLLNNNTLARKLGRNGREFVLSRYTWKDVIDNAARVFGYE